MKATKTLASRANGHSRPPTSPCRTVPIDPYIANEEYEWGILGCLVSHPEEAAAAFGGDLELELFSAPRRTVLETALTMLADDIPLSFITLTNRLHDTGELANVGGSDVITQLSGKYECAVGMAQHYLHELRQGAARRAGADAATWLASVTANSGFDSGSVVEEMQRRAEEIQRLTAGTRKLDLPEIEDAFDLLEEKIPKPPEIVHGLLHQGSKMVIGGGSKSYKTWMLADLALSVSHGAPWMNFETQKGCVLYVNLEIQRAFFRDRLEAISEKRGLRIRKDILHLWNLRGHAADFTVMLPKILKRLKASAYSLIIIDPIYKVLGDRDENAAGDIATLLNMIERLAVESNATVVFGAHFSKGNQAAKESIDRIGGSGVYARDPDTILVLTRHEEDQAFTVETTLRNNPPVEPFVVSWVHPLMELDPTLDPAKLKKAGGRGKDHVAKDLIAAMDGEEISTADWQKKAAEEYGISRTTFYRLLKELTHSDDVKKSAITKKWFRVL